MDSLLTIIIPLLSLLIAALAFGKDLFCSRRDKKEKQQQELQDSRIFVSVTLLRGVKPNLEGFYPNQDKKIHSFNLDSQRNNDSEAWFLKMTNPSEYPLRNIKVCVYAKNNYNDTDRSYILNIPEIIKDEWCMVLLPKDFTSRPATAYFVGLIDKKPINYTYQLRYVEIEYRSPKNELIKVEANANGLIRHYVNDTVLTSFEQKGLYTYGT